MMTKIIEWFVLNSFFFADQVRSAYFDRVNLSANGFYK